MTGARLRALHAVLRFLAPRAWFLEDEVAGVAALVRPGATCLDVGAEYGLYTWTFAHLAGPTGAVHSVEPLPGPARLLAVGVRLLGAGTVHRHRTALGARAGRATMSLPVRARLPVHGRAFLTDGADGLGPNAEFTGQRELPVGVTTLDELVRAEGLARVDVVKADVEGAELAVLRGAAALLERDHPVLLLEVEARHLAKYGATPQELVAHLAASGYRPHTWDGAAWRPAAAVTDGHRNYAFATAPLTP